MLVDFLNILVLHKLRTNLFAIMYEKKDRKTPRNYLFIYSKILHLSFIICVLFFKIWSSFQHILNFKNLCFVLFMKIHACCISNFKSNCLTNVTIVWYTTLQWCRVKGVISNIRTETCSLTYNKIWCVCRKLFYHIDGNF